MARLYAHEKRRRCREPEWPAVCEQRRVDRKKQQEQRRIDRQGQQE